MKIKIGNIELESNVILAPLSGVTDLVFRKVVKKFGAGLVVSEMIASAAMIRETRQSLRKCAIVLDDATSACVQLAGCNPQIMAEAARMNEHMGAKIIDINFGCPAIKVVGSYAGSALMKDEILAGRILEQVVNAVNIPVTLKMRTGWDDQNRNAVALAKIAESSGIKMVTVHGRTRNQFYSGVADWKFIREVKEAINIPVIANGDINSYQAATQAIKDSGADGIMVGRGVYGRPWFLAQLDHFLKTGIETSSPPMQSQYETVINHYEGMIEHYGEDVGCKMARKHLGWYSSGLVNSSDYRAKINSLTSIVDVKAVIKEYYSNFV